VLPAPIRRALALVLAPLLLALLLLWAFTQGDSLLGPDPAETETRQLLRRRCEETIRRLEQEHAGQPLSKWPEEARQAYESARRNLKEMD
jgi:hypothetical protein